MIGSSTALNELCNFLESHTGYDFESLGLAFKDSRTFELDAAVFDRLARTCANNLKSLRIASCRNLPFESRQIVFDLINKVVCSGAPIHWMELSGISKEIEELE